MKTKSDVSTQLVTRRRLWTMLIAASLFVFGVYGCFAFVICFRFVNEPHNAASFGQFGDSFGAINAFFSAIAFATVAVSLYLQSQEITSSIGLLVESNRNQRASNLLNAIESFSQISRCQSFDPFRLLHNESERAIPFQLFSSKLLIAGIFAEDKNAAQDFPTLAELRLKRENAIRLFAVADEIMNQSDILTYSTKSPILEQLDKVFAQIATNTLDCITDNKWKVLTDLQFQRLRQDRRSVREALAATLGGSPLTDELKQLERSLSKKHMLLACEVLRIGVLSLGLPCDFTKEVRDWSKD